MAITVSRTGRQRRVVNEINVVPYIDVMLVLLVIFMVTAPLLLARGHRPAHGGQQPDQAGPVSRSADSGDRRYGAATQQC